jgi:hypothetical protein
MVELLTSPLLRLALAWGWLLSWGLTFHRLPCPAVLLFAVPVALAILLGMVESALLRRRALAGMYLRPEGALFRLLRGGVILAGWQALKAILFAILLLMAATQWETTHWAVLGLDALLLAGLFGLVRRRLAGQVRPGFDALFARQLLVYLNTVLFVAVLAWVEFHLPHPDYRQASLAEAVLSAVSQVTACDAVGILVRGGAASQAAGWWLAQTWLTRPEIAPLAGLGWLLFLAWSATFMWGYSRLLLGALVSPGGLLEMLETPIGREDKPECQTQV